MNISTKEMYSYFPLRYPLGSKDTILSINREKSQGKLTPELVVRTELDKVRRVRSMTWAQHPKLLRECVSTQIPARKSGFYISTYFS